MGFYSPSVFLFLVRGSRKFGKGGSGTARAYHLSRRMYRSCKSYPNFSCAWFSYIRQAPNINSSDGWDWLFWNSVRLGTQHFWTVSPTRVLLQTNQEYGTYSFQVYNREHAFFGRKHYRVSLHLHTAHDTFLHSCNVLLELRTLVQQQWSLYVKLTSISRKHSAPVTL